MINIRFAINDEIWFLKDVLVQGHLYLTFNNGNRDIKLEFNFDDSYESCQNGTPSLDTIYSELYKKVEYEEWE